jgi:hypothetical protein
MTRLRLAVLAMITAASWISFVVAEPAAKADPPQVGTPCPTLHATTQDADGRTMWCNPTMTGNHSLVWQYGGPG